MELKKYLRNEEGSYFYRSYYRDYIGKDVTGKNGKPKKELIYAGDYYTAELSDRNLKLMKLLQPALLLCSFMFYLWASAKDIALNREWLSMAVQGFSVIAFIFYISAVVQYIVRPVRMTIWQYSISSLSLKKTSRITAVCMLIAAAEGIFLCIADRSLLETEVYICSAAWIISALCAFMAFFTENAVNYKKEPSDEKLALEAEAAARRREILLAAAVRGSHN